MRVTSMVYVFLASWYSFFTVDLRRVGPWSVACVGSRDLQENKKKQQEGPAVKLENYDDKNSRYQRN